MKFGSLTIIDLFPTPNGNYFKCKCDCGNIVTKSPQIVKNGQVTTCGRNCPIHIQNKQHKLFFKYLNQRFGSSIVIGFKLLPLNNSTKLRTFFKMKCDCGNEHYKLSSHIMNGKIINCGDSNCSHFINYRNPDGPDLDKYKSYIGQKFNHLTVLDTFRDNTLDCHHNRFKVQCDCGNITIKSVYTVLNNESKTCGISDCSCSLMKQHHYYNNSEFIGKTYNQLTITGISIRPRDLKYQFICKCHKCGNDNFIITKNQFFSFRPITCNKCSTNSNVELDFNEFLKSKNIKYDKSRIESYLEFQDLVEIDFLLEQYNVGIELHGLFTHATILGDYDNPYLGRKPIKYHLNKTLSSKKHNIDLLQFWNTEWLQKREIVESIILNRIGMSPYKQYARNCSVKEIDKKTYNQFMNNNHIQGTTNGESIRLGLFYKYNNNLVSVMSFGSSRYSKHLYEMFRFCNCIYSNVVGAASKLFKYFFRNYNPTSIVSYSDRRLFDNGKLYDILGFKLDHVSDPGYWYFKGSDHTVNVSLLHRSQFMKHKLKDKLNHFDPNLTEWENMENNGYLRVYDCGNKVYVWKNIDDDIV